MIINCYKTKSLDEINTSLEFFNFCENNLNDIKTNFINIMKVTFPLNKQNEIIEILDCFIPSLKYNL
jgi:hypothetical protein